LQNNGVVFLIVISNGTTYPIFTKFPSFDISTYSLKPDPNLVYEFFIGTLAAVFLLLLAIGYFILANFG